MVTYVNSPTERTNGGSTETSRSGQSKIFRLVGLGFGLLCLMQLTLNLLLWRRSQGLFHKSDNSSSCTFTWDDIRALALERDRLAEEKNQLIHTNEQLLHENARLASERSSLQNHNNQLSERNRMLNEQVTKQQRHIQRLQTTITASKDQQDEEKNQLLHKNEQLRNEKDQLASAKDLLHQENQQLKAEKTKLQEANARLTEDIRKLNERLTEREVTPQNLFPLTCPVGWWRHMSSCYQLSSQEGTWENAKLSCETQGAHLVILNHPEEEKAVRAFGRCFAVWIGLKRESFTWTWVDRSFLSETYRNHLHHCYYPYSCVYLQDVPPSNAWFSGTCQLHFRWICELEL